MTPRRAIRPDRASTDVTFWGTRGSIPVPSPDTAVYGGNTCCMEVNLVGPAADTRIVIDAGTGIRKYGDSRAWAAGDEVHLLLSHLHHDHIMGLPFFKAAHVPGLMLHIWCGNLDGADAREAMDRLFSPPLFPLTPSDMPATVVHHGFRAGETIRVGGHDIATILLDHPSGATGYRFGAGPSSLAVITDVEHAPDGPDPGLVEFCRGVDTLIYDTMLQDGDYSRCQGWGHSTCAAGLALVRAAGVRRLAGFHHSPWQTDAELAAREALLKAHWPDALMAREGQTLRCGERGAARLREPAVSNHAPAH